MEKTCEKISFNSAEEADKELRRILETQTKPWAERDKKPCRKYKCSYCSTTEKEVWHLTSAITTITY